MRPKTAAAAGQSKIKDPESKILAIHPGALGDVVLFGQLLAALRQREGGPVRLVARGERASLLAGLGVVDEALDFDALPMEEAFAPARQEGRLSERLGKCGLLVSCFAAGDEHAERRLAAACSAERALFLPVRLPADFAGHLTDLWAALAGVESVPPPGWHVPEAWRQQAGEALARAGVGAERQYVLIHPGSGSREKCWPLERFTALAGRLAASGEPGISSPAPLYCVFVLGPAELDWWSRQSVASLRSGFPTILAPTLSVLAALSAGAAAYLGNDSGPTHLAAAVGSPTLALFGPSDPTRFGPRGRRVRVLAGHELPAISVEQVARALQNV